MSESGVEHAIVAAPARVELKACHPGRTAKDLILLRVVACGDRHPSEAAAICIALAVSQRAFSFASDRYQGPTKLRAARWDHAHNWRRWMEEKGIWVWLITLVVFEVFQDVMLAVCFVAAVLLAIERDANSN